MPDKIRLLFLKWPKKGLPFFKFTPFAHLPSYFLFIFKLNFYMRKILFLLLALPLLGISQTKNVVSSTRVFPKVDKVAEFEKALAAHAKKYHTGDFKWRVFEIESGPDAGGYHTTEGPLSWESIDSRGNLGAEHNRAQQLWPAGRESNVIYRAAKGCYFHLSYRAGWHVSYDSDDCSGRRHFSSG